MHLCVLTHKCISCSVSRDQLESSRVRARCSRIGVHGLIGGCVLWETTRCTWVCTDDQVYMGDHELCKQYVLSDFGNIFYGNQQEISAKPWNYGQVLHV